MPTRSRQLLSFALLGMLAACSSTSPDATEDAALASGASSSAGEAAVSSGQASPTSSTNSAGGAGPSGTTAGTTGSQVTSGNGTGGQISTASGIDTSSNGTGGGTSMGTGASSGAGGASTADATSASVTTASATGTTGSMVMGDISITDAAPGFASVSGGTHGGGADIGSAITVNSMSALQSAAQGSTPAIILLEPGNYSGSLSLGSNKTIIGIAPGVTITGNIEISGSDANNVIIRNLAVRGERCASYDECRAGDDAVYMGNGAHHIWLDHLDIADGQDGNCDATRGADFITVSWTRFHYTYDKEHRFSNLIAGSDDEPESVGKLRITYMNNHWGERVDQRQPRGRFGNIHMLNNYHETGSSQIHGVGKDMALIAENCVYDENRSIWTDMGSPRGWRGIGNEGTAADMNDSFGSVFEIPYDYTPLPASEVVSAVTSSECGAGNTCTLAY